MPDGSLLIVDTAGHRVLRLRGEMITIVAGGIWPGASTGDGGPAADAGLYFPTCIAADAEGNFYVGEAGAGRVRRVDQDGTITTIAGTGIPDRFSRPSTGAAAGCGIGEISALACQGDGKLLISDASNWLVYEIDLRPSEPTLNVLAGTGGSPGTTYGSTHRGAEASQTPLGQIMDLTPTGDGGYLLSDVSNGRVDLLNPMGTLDTVVPGVSLPGGGCSVRPMASAYLPDGTIVVVDHRRGALVAA
jgi:hypothetical protein